MVYIILLPIFVTYFNLKLSSYPFTYPTETRFDFVKNYNKIGI